MSLYDLSTGEAAGLHGHSQRVLALAFSPDGEKLASASGDGTIRLWHVRTRQALLTLRDDPCGTVEDLAFTPDGEALVTGGSAGRGDNPVCIWPAPRTVGATAKAPR